MGWQPCTTRTSSGVSVHDEIRASLDEQEVRRERQSRILMDRIMARVATQRT